MNDNPLNVFLDPDAFDEVVAENFKLRNLHLRNNSLRYLPHDLWPGKRIDIPTLTFIAIQYFKRGFLITQTQSAS